MAGKQKKERNDEDGKVAKNLSSLYIHSKKSDAESEAITKINTLVGLKKSFSGTSLAVDILNKYTPLEIKEAREEKERRSRQAG